MNSTTIIKQILDAHKKMFDDSLNLMTAFQEQTEKMACIFCEKSAFFPLESRKLMEDWTALYKNSLDDFKTNADKRFKLMEYYLINTADQVESSLHTVVDKAVPASQAYEATPKTDLKRKKKDTTVTSTAKKKRTTRKDQ